METIEQLDAEIEELRARVSTLQTHRANLSSILLSQPRLESRLEQRLVSDERRRRTVVKLATQQSKRNQENIYRACAGVTAFKVKDPDPCAVDNGNILGVRVDISVGGRFVETYHVLFNRPSKKHDSVLRIHKHTIPPCIPLQQLVNKWLPATKRSAETAVQQNLVSFGRQLRKELVSWHMRIEAVEKLRLDAGLGRKGTCEHEEKEQTTGKVLNAFVSDDDDSQDEEEPATQLHAPAKIIEIESDVGVREITITWSNEQRGVIRVSKDGQIEQAAVRSRDGVRDMSLSRKALGRIEGLVQRLNA